MSSIEEEKEFMPCLTEEQRKELKNLRTKLTEGIKLLDIVLSEKRRGAERDDNDEPTWNFSVKVRIPSDFYVTKKLYAYAINHGLTDEDIPILAGNFIEYYRKHDKKWAHWTVVWQQWVRRENEARVQKASVAGKQVHGGMKEW
jgi:hypothetical protein